MDSDRTLLKCHFNYGGTTLTNPMAFKRTRSLRYLLSLIVLPALLVLLAACSSSTPLMAVLFDMPPPGRVQSNEPPARKMRRAPPPSGAPVLILSKEHLEALAEAKRVGAPPNWPVVFKGLPKDDDGNIDWGAALESKIISPGGVINTLDQDAGKTSEDDIELATSGKPNRMVIFSHKVHTQWLTCTNCHNAIFKREAGNAKITMAAIDDGKYCGVCHDKVALAQPSGCKGCHKPIKKS